MNIHQKIASELHIRVNQVDAAVKLLDEGSTVPFISRYRKEATGNLSDTDLRNLEERLQYLRELQERRSVVLKSIQEQNKLTPELEQAISSVDNKAQLEDLYLPYKPKRRTKAQIAREAGLEPLSILLLNETQQIPETSAEAFINAELGIVTVQDALEGAKQILMETFSEQATLIDELRTFVWQHATIHSEVIAGKEISGEKFKDYFSYQEAIHKIPSHRTLALLRGQREEILSIKLVLTDNDEAHCQQQICQHLNIKNGTHPGDKWLLNVVNFTWRVKFSLKLEVELIMRLREAAELEAIKVFANNLKHLLMSAPAGSHTTLGLDPGLRTGVKTVVVSDTGKLLFHTVIYPHAPRNDWHGSLKTLKKICQEYNVSLVSIGNGTGSRETDKLVTELRKENASLNLTSLVVSEAGASVYSASKLAAEEFPDLDVSFRGAVSIARRLQDPLAELVKIDPKAIGVGQYQHDVNQTRLARMLHNVMEDCVNAVGVDVNTASVPLLTCIAGLNDTIAKNIVLFRDEVGKIKNRKQLKKVPRLGDKTFEQAAGFLRIMNGDNPLDASAVHPEAYVVVEKILQAEQQTIKELMGNHAILHSLNAAKFTDDNFGIPTVSDIIRELEKPGRDPRPEFKTAKFLDDVSTINDLKPGMLLEGVVTNVANFGAFVDVGVHQDGLVHISQLKAGFIKSPHDAVKVNDIVQVKVLEVDTARKRIQLTMILDKSPTATPRPKTVRQEEPANIMQNALADALRKFR